MHVYLPFRSAQPSPKHALISLSLLRITGEGGGIRQFVKRFVIAAAVYDGFERGWEVFSEPLNGSAE